MDFAAPVRCCSSAAAAAAAMSGAGCGVLPFRCGFESERATAPSPRLTTSRRDTWPRALAWMWVAAAYAELKCPIRSRGVVLAVNAPTGGKVSTGGAAFRLEEQLSRSRRRAKIWRRQRSASQAYPVPVARVSTYQVTTCSATAPNLPHAFTLPHTWWLKISRARAQVRATDKGPLSTVQTGSRRDLVVAGLVSRRLSSPAHHYPCESVPRRARPPPLRSDLGARSSRPRVGRGALAEKCEKRLLTALPCLIFEL